MIHRTSIVRAATRPISRDLEGETIILQLDVGRYFGLNAVASRVWALLQQPRSVGDIRDVLTEEYEVDPEQCEKDLQALLEDLAGKGLIEVKNP